MTGAPFLWCSLPALDAKAAACRVVGAPDEPRGAWGEDGGSRVAGPLGIWAIAAGADLAAGLWWEPAGSRGGEPGRCGAAASFCESGGCPAAVRRRLPAPRRESEE